MKPVIVILGVLILLFSAAAALLSTRGPAVEEAAVAPAQDESNSAAAQSAPAQSGPIEQVIQKVRKESRAPDIVSSIWLNSPALTPPDLHGHVVVVEFWTYG